MEDLEVEINIAETFFLQVLKLDIIKPTPKAIKQYEVKEFDALNPIDTEPEPGYFEADVYDVLLKSYKLPEIRVENCCSQLISLQPIIYFFEGGIVILALQARLLSADNVLLGDWLRFIEAFRWVHLRRFQEWMWKDKIVKPIEPLPNWAKKINDNLTARTIISIVFNKIFGQDVDIAKTNYPLFRNYGKLFVSSFLDLKREISDENFYHILFVDRPAGLAACSDPLPSQEKLRQEMAENTYNRWRHQNQYYGFSGYSFCLVLTPNEERTKSISAEQFQVYFRTRYHILYLIALLELSIQTRFIFELNDILRKIDNGKNSQYKEDQLYNEISGLRKKQLEINGKTWFGRVTLETQPRELFNIARQVLQTDKLHDEIVEKLSQLDEYLNARSQFKMSSRMDLLQRIITPLLLIGSIFSFFQIPSIESIFNSWFDLIKLPHYIGILSITLLLTAILSWIIDNFVWRKSK